MCLCVFWSNAVSSCRQPLLSSQPGSSLQPADLQESPLYGEFLLVVQYVLGRGRENSWVGGVWHQGDTVMQFHGQVII